MTSMGSSIVNDMPTVMLSVLVAVLATCSALDLAGRVRSAVDAMSARLWIIAGAVAMGSGVWAMHFVGLSAADSEFPTRYEAFGSVLSWVAAVGLSAFMLTAAGWSTLRWRAVVALAITAGVGATAMHFIGMSALIVTPAMTIDPFLVGVAVLTATVGSGIAMTLFAMLRGTRGKKRTAGHLATALVLGSSLAAMHYISMFAVKFADGTVCLTTRGGLDAEELGQPLGYAAVVFMALTMMTTALERRAARRAVQLGGSLERTQRELEYVSFTDVTTGLPNRTVFQDRLAQAVQRSRRSGLSIAILAIEIDGYEQVLERFDDGVVKTLMCDTGAALAGTLRASDTLASSGQHRFLALMDDLQDIEPARRAAEAMRAAAAKEAHAEAPRITVSIGIVVFPHDGPEARAVGNAVAALSLAQRQGGNCTVFFEAYRDSEARAQAEWIRDLRLALERREFELHYQPKVHCESGSLVGTEALLRWTHPVRGPVSPAVFIPIAEKAGLMNDIGLWVLEEACRQMGQWQREGRAINVAVNLSAHQLRQADLPEIIISMLERFNVDPQLLTCEITETAAMDDTDATTAVLARMKQKGFFLSIDDFGTGFSSLSYLRKLPVRQLKIDRSFVGDLSESQDAEALVKGIIELAHALRLEVVAEGVETRAQRVILQRLGCDKLQGFLFSRPLNAKALAVWADENGTPGSTDGVRDGAKDSAKERSTDRTTDRTTIDA